MSRRVTTTKMSSKGQVVIPEAVRRQMALEAGDRFVVVGDGDVLVLQRLKTPDLSDFAVQIGQAERSAQAASPPIEVDALRLGEVCRRYGVRRLALFGPTHPEEMAGEDKVDLLVVYEEGRAPGIGLFALERELSELIDRAVELNTVEFLSAHVRDRVVREARDLYAAA